MNHTNADTASLCSADFHQDLSDDQNRKPPVVIEALCLVGDVKGNSEVKKAAESLQLDVLFSETGEEYRGDSNVAFVLSNFSGPDFNYLHAAGRRIFGPTAILESASSRRLPIRSKIQPLYCQSMKGIVCALSGFKNRNQTLSTVDKIHFMGGSVRKNWTPQITHLIANTTQSEKYRLAISMGVPAMKLEWVDHCWSRRHKPLTTASSKELESKYKMPAFYDLRLSLLGLKEEEAADINEFTAQNGGQIVALSSTTTHLVVERGNDKDELPSLPSNKTHLVTTEWFWVSVQLGLCANESLYPVNPPIGPRKRPINSPECSERSSRRSQVCKKRSLSDRSLDAGFDASSDIDTLPEHIFSTEDIESLIHSPQKQTSKRRQCCVELLQTERNYVDVLKIMMNYKEGLEEEEAKDEEPLLTKAEMQLIFGKVGPIYAIHQEICSELVNLIMHWNENRLIGRVWVQAADRLERCYPPFMNNYDQAKQTLVNADKTRPRLHAFLKARQSRPESQRQSLIELLIRPIQRLPSVTLLLQEVLKRTDKSNPDCSNLQRALEAIRKVLAHINEDKRKTEDRMKIFEIFNGIENCPVEFVTSQRQFLSRLDVQDLSGGYAKHKGQVLTLYLFNDALEVTKKRTLRASEEHPESPLPLTPNEKGGTMSKFHLPRPKLHKTHKHIKLLSLTAIRRVSDVKGYDTDFLLAITVREQTSEDTWAFQAVGVNETAKRDFLKVLCYQVMSMCGPSRSVGPYCHSAPESDTPDGHVPMTPTAQLIDDQFKKAFRHHRPGNRRLTRKLSFSQAPSNSLRRAVSTMTLRMTGTLQRMSRSNLRLTNISELPSPQLQSTPRSLVRGSSRDDQRAHPSCLIQSSAVHLPKTAAPTAI